VLLEQREQQGRQLATAAAEQARAEEARKTAAAERQARRRTLALAGAVLLLVIGGGSAGWWIQQKQQAANTASAGAMAEARLLLDRARSAPLPDAGKYREALEAARKAEQLATTGGASAAVRRQATDLVAELEREVEAADRDRRLLVRLPDIRGPREGPKYRKDDKGYMVELAEPSADEEFADAFRQWGLDVDATPTGEAAARLRKRSASMVVEVIAALDEWASERRWQGRPEAEWRRLADLAAALDEEPGSLRREVRAILARGRLPVERALGVLSAALRPVPVPVEVPLGMDRGRLRQLAERTDPVSEPVLGLLTLARALLLAGEEALAERLLRAAIEARPREVVLYHALGQLLPAQQPPRWAEAVVCYTAARALRPDLGVRLARALIGSGRDRDGLALLDRLVKETPDNPYLHFQQGLALYGKGDVEGAIARFRQAIALDPKYATAHYNLGVALKDKGDVEGAIARYRQAIELDPKYATAHNNLGVVLHHKHDVEGAIARFRQAIALDPKDAQAHYNLGLALYHKHDLEGAIAHYRQAIELDPRNAPAHNNLGLALQDRGDLEGGIACFRQAIELDPKLAQAHNNLGVALKAKGDLEGAIAHYRQAIELDPKDALAHGDLGVALYGKGDVEGAIARFRQAIALDPKLAQAHYNLGLALKAKGDVEGAVAEYRKAIELDPKDALAHYNLGLALYHKHDLEGAIAHYRQAIELDPRNAAAHTTLGLALQDRGDVEGAIARYRRAIALDPKLAQAHCNLGNALAAKGDLEGAVAEYRKAITIDPKDAHSRGALGQALLRQGRYAEAREWTRSALRLLPQGHPLHQLVASQLQRCEQYLALDKKLSAVLQGEAPPANPAEAVALAQMCQQHKKRHVAAARLYADAFAAEPKLATNLNAQHRYHAARSAALASTGQGEDARLLPDKVVAMLRRWALGWLRDDLAAYGKITQQSNPGVKRAVQQRLTRWQKDFDLAGLRAKAALDKLPAAERDAWQRLWADVAALLQRAQEK
jgi:superkiller protein 3